MNQLKEVVNAVLEQQKLQLAPSTYDARKNYLKHLVEYGDYLGIQVPCQELYDAYVARAVTPDLRFQLLHAVRLVDKEAGTKALTPEGKLYNEPKLPSSSESEEVFFPHLPDGSTCKHGGSYIHFSIFPGAPYSRGNPVMLLSKIPPKSIWTAL